MKIYSPVSAILSITLLLLMSACGGSGGSDGGGAGSNGVKNNSWLHFSPATVDVVTIVDVSRSFFVDINSDKQIAKKFNAVVIDGKGVIAPDIIFSAHSDLYYTASLRTSPKLLPGTYLGEFEVRLCYDDPTICGQPVDGSPWHIPYKIKVLGKSEIHYSRWDVINRSAGFINNFSLGIVGKNLITIESGLYSGVMETWISEEAGGGWRNLNITGPNPRVRDFAITGNGDAIYFSGGVVTSPGDVNYGKYSNSVWKYDGSTWELKNAAAGFSGRDQHVMVKIGNGLFVIGGRNESGYLTDVWKSTDDGASWTKVADSLPFGFRFALRTYVCAVNWNNSIALFGTKLGGGILITSSDGINWTERLGYSAYAANFRLGSGVRHCGMHEGRLFLNPPNSGDMSASTADLENWQPELARYWGVGDFDAPGMVSVNGHLFVLTGVGTSERQTLRTVP